MTNKINKIKTTAAQLLVHFYISIFYYIHIENQIGNAIITLFGVLDTCIISNEY